MNNHKLNCFFSEINGQISFFCYIREIVGIKKSNSKYELTVNITAENVIINNVNIDYPLLSEVIPEKFPISILNFYIDNNRNVPTYRQPRDWDPQKDYKFDFLEYMYVYVAETLTIYEERKYENIGPPWSSINIDHFDLDFSQPGWYKICVFDTNYNNNKFKNDNKHRTG